jgi:uncharacterized protein DUF748
MRRRQLAIAAALVTVAVVVWVATRGLDEPLRRHMEGQLDASLKGYRVRIGRLRVHLLGGSVELLDSTIVQVANPEPPVANVPRLRASVHWRALLHGALVADFWFDRPELNIDVRQAATEVSDRVPIRQRGWQDAVEHIYPLKINRLRVTDGRVNYTPDKPFAPLHLRMVNFSADNVRNVRSRDRTYPSDVHLDAYCFDAAEVRADGRADFLAEPHVGVQVYVSSYGIPLWYATPVIARWASVQRGSLSVDTMLEYGPHVAAVDVDDLTVTDAEAWYVRTADNAPEERRATERTVAAARHASDNPEIRLHATRVRVERGTFGVVDRIADPPYAIFVSDADLRLGEFSNQRSAGPSTLEVHGKFMGSGDAQATASFLPQKERPDFDLDVRIEDTDLESMNGLLRSSAGVDVAKGKLSLYTQMSVRDTRVTGYVKPIIKELDVYSSEKSRDESWLHKVHEQLVGALATVLKNHSRDEIATRTEISGPLTDPRTSLWQTIVNVVRNAYIQAIRPGLEQKGAG